MPSCQHLKPLVRRVFYQSAHTVEHKTKMSVTGLIWQRATKETHSSLPTVETATFLGVAHFNDGSTCLISVLKHLGIVPGGHCKRSCAKLDSDRIRHSRRKSGELAKKRQKNIRKWKKGYTDILAANEGPSYEAGAF